LEGFKTTDGDIASFRTNILQILPENQWRQRSIGDRKILLGQEKSPTRGRKGYFSNSFNKFAD
jgi:hypothetical protein